MADSSDLSLQAKISILGSFHLYSSGTTCHPAARQGAARRPSRLRQDISIFLRWWQGTFGETDSGCRKADPFRLNRKTIQDSWPGCKLPRVMRQHCAALCCQPAGFCQFLQNEGFIQHDPALGLRLPVRDPGAERTG